MKKSTAPVKRLARARIVELNGTAERVELLLLTFMAPLWGIVFPLIGLTQLGNYGGAVIICASLFCLLHFLHLNNDRFSFEEKGVRLPGVDNRVVPYANLERIYLKTASPPVLAIEYMPLSNIFPESKEREPGIFEIQHLTEENARELWSLFATHLKSCAISLDVRDKLINWRIQAGDQAPLSIGPNVPSTRAIKGSPLPETGSTHNAEIARDLSMLLELKPFDPVKLVGQYMVSYSDTFKKTWLTCWSIVAAVAYPLTIASMVAIPLAEHHAIAGTVTSAVPQTQMSITDWFSNYGEQMTKVSQASIEQFFGNHLGAIGLVVLLYFAITKFMRYANAPDSMFIDYLGITTEKRSAQGVKPLGHRSWKTIESIGLLRPTERSNSSRWSVVFGCGTEKQPIAIPFKAFSSDRLRQQFIDCLDTWGRRIHIDPNLLEALAPRGQASYTELWLSALSAAPKIDELTPHSVGLRLQNRVYEIESQLASGGQGVAYLARKLKANVAVKDAEAAASGEKTSSEKTSGEKISAPEAVEQAGEKTDECSLPQEIAAGEYEQVVLKETVLPIYVDNRARAKALARFERDAKLLASLEHPLIVKLEDFFVENNRAYLALEYIHGKTLKEKVDSEGPLEEEEVRRLALMMTDILDYLHNRTPQVVHRDFTPDNLMLTSEGQIKLIDFDVALEQSSFSQTNATIVGKQAYIPLEQFRGKPSSQSDIYALGATLYYLLTGEEPSALQSSRPKELRPEVSETLDDIIAKATAVDPGDRVQSAAALRQLLLGPGDVQVGNISIIEIIEADSPEGNIGGESKPLPGAVKLVVAPEPATENAGEISGTIVALSLKESSEDTSAEGAPDSATKTEAQAEAELTPEISAVISEEILEETTEPEAEKSADIANSSTRDAIAEVG
jgi:serine/threonine protein kinase